MRRTPMSEWRDHLKTTEAAVKHGGLVHARYISKETPSRTGKTALIREYGCEGYVLVQFDDLNDPFSHGWHPMRAEKFEVLR